jgi:signal transduction histidine kinase
MDFEPRRHYAISPPSLSNSSDWLVHFKQLPEVSEGNLEKVLPIITESLSKNLFIDRVSIWEFSQGNEILTCLDAYIAKNEQHEHGKQILVDDFPRYFSAITNHNIIKADDVLRHPFTREFIDNYFKEIPIKSMLDVPFYDDGILKGVICYEQTEKIRNWTSEEVMFTNCMGMIISLVYEKIKLKKYYKEIQQLYIESQLHNRQIEEQKRILQEQKSEIIAQNEELRQQQEELEAQTNLLSEQNLALQRAKNIIDLQKEELENYSVSLEKKILLRTKELEIANNELIIHNHQLEQFAYITAHNLRSPVARILGLVNLLNPENVDDANKEILQYIVSCTSELDRVIKDLNQILEIKKGQEKPMEKVNLSILWASLCQEFKDKTKEAKIESNFEEINEIITIAPYLESVLHNLFSNAIKYKANNRPLEISIQTKKLNHKVAILFKDNGIGINMKKYKQKIFGLYQRFHNHVEGKGIGLYLVKTQIDVMGGKINIESEEGEGTKFLIVLPTHI